MRIKGEVKGAKKIMEGLRKRRDRLIDRCVAAIALDLLEESRIVVKKKSGGLADSLRRRRLASMMWAVVEGAIHGLFYRTGTPPHVILPRVKRALWWPGLDHPVARVNHPGTKAVPYPAYALRRARRDIYRRTAELAGRIGGQITARMGR